MTFSQRSKKPQTKNICCKWLHRCGTVVATQGASPPALEALRLSAGVGARASQNRFLRPVFAVPFFASDFLLFSQARRRARSRHAKAQEGCSAPQMPVEPPPLPHPQASFSIMAASPRRRRRRCIFFFSSRFHFVTCRRRAGGQVFQVPGRRLAPFWMEPSPSEGRGRHLGWTDGRAHALAPRRQLCRPTSRRFGKTRVVFRILLCRLLKSCARLGLIRELPATCRCVRRAHPSAPLLVFTPGSSGVLLCFLSRSVTAILGRLIVDDPSPGGHRRRPDRRSSVSAA